MSYDVCSVTQCVNYLWNLYDNMNMFCGICSLMYRSLYTNAYALESAS